MLTTTDKMILWVVIVVCVVGFLPAVKNFQVVWKDKNNTKVIPAYRRFFLAYLGLGVCAIMLMFFFLNLLFDCSLVSQREDQARVFGVACLNRAKKFENLAPEAHWVLALTTKMTATV